MTSSTPQTTKQAAFHRLKSFVWSETKRLFRDAWQTGWKASVYASPVLLLLGILLMIQTGDSRASWWEYLLLFVVVVCYVLFWAFWLGLIAAGVRVVWRVFGRAILVPLIAIPLAVALCLWLASGWLAASALDVKLAFEQAVLAHGIEKPRGSLHMGGEAFLILLLPILLLHYAPALFDPAVLWQLTLLILYFSLVILSGVIPSTLASLTILSRSLWRLWRERYQVFLSETSNTN